jgi:hypothetical protein
MQALAAARVREGQAQQGITAVASSVKIFGADNESVTLDGGTALTVRGSGSSQQDNMRVTGGLSESEEDGDSEEEEEEELDRNEDGGEESEADEMGGGTKRDALVHGVAKNTIDSRDLGPQLPINDTISDGQREVVPGLSSPPQDRHPAVASGSRSFLSMFQRKARITTSLGAGGAGTATSPSFSPTENRSSSSVDN